MLAKLIRIPLAVILAPLMGAMLLRGYAGVLMSDPSADLLGWLAGAVLGILYAILLLVLCVARPGTPRRAAGDLLLLALCALALADLVGQLTRTTVPGVFHVTAAVYGVGMLVAARVAARR